MNSRTIVAMIMLVVSSHALAGEVATVAWRGDGNGNFPNAKCVSEWSPTKNIVWSTDMPDWSNSSPILVDGKLFVCSEPSTLICLNAKDGKILWSQSSDAKDALGASEKRPKCHKVTGYSSPTPTTDGKGIFVVYATGVAAAYELDGTRRWIKSIDRPEHGWGQSASPVFAGGHLIVSVVNIVALDPKTGKQAWEVKSSARWGSPIVTKIRGRDYILTPNGEFIRAKDGKIMAKHKSKLEYNGVIVKNGVFYGFDGKSQAFAYEITDKWQLKPLWRAPVNKDRYYASPVIVNGILFGLTQKGILTAIDARKGKKLYEKDIKVGRTCYPSLTIIGKNLFASSDNGKTVIIKPGRTYSEIARNSLEAFRSCPLPVGDKIYLRTLSKFYCIGK